MNRILPILAMLMAAVAAVSCGDDDYYDYGDFRYDMVTYDGCDGDGIAQFSRIERDDAGVTTLITTNSCNLSASDGQRMLLNYIPEGDAVDGVQQITAKSYTVAITDSLRATTRDNILTLAMDSVKLKSIWRTGEYINIYCQVKYTTEARYLSLIMDYSTWMSDTVHCYLYHDMLDATTYFWRSCYMSFYVGAVWQLSSCKALRIHLTDVAYPDVEHYDFTKN